MKKRILIVLFMILSFVSKAQYHFSITQYTSTEGLSQNSITAIMKDKKGYLWFGTRYGLNKFDGYKFTTYSSNSNLQCPVQSNRILFLKEDKWGFIWIKTYDEIIYRLNPSNNEFTQIENSNGGFINDKIEKICFSSSGMIWLTTTTKGCYRVFTDRNTGKLTVTLFEKSKNLIPDNSVNSVFEDNQKNTWILTQKGICNIDNSGNSTFYFTKLPFHTYNENEKRIIFGSLGKILIYDKRSKLFKFIDISTNSNVLNISNFNSNHYIFTASDNGFYTYDVLRDKLQQYSIANYPEMKSNNVQQIYIDRAGDAWLALLSSGVIHFNTQTNKIVTIESKLNVGQITNPNFLIFEDEKDILWIQPYYGSFSWYDRKNDRLVPFKSAFNYDANTLFSYGVNHVLADSQGVFWISTNRGNGFFKCTFLPEYFNHYLFQENSIYSISNEVRSIFEDKNNRLWVACKDGKVHVYDNKKNSIGSLNKDGRILPNGNFNVLVYNMMQDKSGVIWLATKKQGIFRLSPQGSSNNFKVENFKHNPADNYSPMNDDFYSIVQDKLGRIWAGSYGAGLHLIVERDGKFKFLHAKNELKNYPITNCSKIRQLFVDSKQRIWIGTTEGVVMFKSNFTNHQSVKYDYYHKIDNSPTSIGANDVHCISEDSESNMWFGTFGGGLNKLVNKGLESKNFKFEVIDRNSGMPGNVVYTIVDDKQNNLWLTTENSIVKYDKKNKTIQVFGKGNELDNVAFSEAASCYMQSGEICLGSKSGFYSFRPEAVKRRVVNAPLVFTGLNLFNKEVEVGKEGSILSNQIDNTSNIEFNHKQNVFTIEFATLDMRAPEKIQYAYKLEGFDSEWNYVQNKHFATYTVLPPGKYTFMVKSTDSEGVWLNNQREIQLEILPSFWQSIYAKILYVILFIALFVIVLYIFATILKLKNSVHIEKEMTDMKLRFFTDVSHELRTPLTLISLPIDNMLEEKLDPYLQEQLTLVRRNLDKVMVLINQILDLRKIQNNKMRLSIQELNFGEYLSSLCSNFAEMAHKKNVTLKFIDESNNAKVWADPERLDTIVNNLLSNSLKFTPSGKKIVVQITEKQGEVVLIVIDEGIGIAQEKINFIFDRFFSVSTLKSIAQKSTGIGLDLVKKMVDLHHAVINVESQLGKGTTFKIAFKIGTNHFGDNVDIVISDKTVPTEVYEDEQTIELLKDDSEIIKPLILIVEDNDELRHFLMKSLKNKFRVLEAENGLKGWQQVENFMPDFIVADLRMPIMDGMELTIKVREDNRTSHIPIILLTADTDIDSKVESMKAGADDYITKPFNSSFLHARIENLMHQRMKLQQFYRTQIVKSKPDLALTPLEIREPEDLFMKKLIKLMNDNLENFDLNIDFLASGLNMSRTIFFNKLKTLTGYSPIEFVREVRLERAAEYMRETQLTISEISYNVGIGDPRYFSRCFKTKFGETPSEYKLRYSNE